MCWFFVGFFWFFFFFLEVEQDNSKVIISNRTGEMSGDVDKNSICEIVGLETDEIVLGVD